MIRDLVMKTLAKFIFAGLLVALAGCNTIEGAGKDIEQAGKAIKEEARVVRNKM